MSIADHICELSREKGSYLHNFREFHLCQLISETSLEGALDSKYVGDDFASTLLSRVGVIRNLEYWGNHATGLLLYGFRH